MRLNCIENFTTMWLSFWKLSSKRPNGRTYWPILVVYPLFECTIKLTSDSDSWPSITYSKVPSEVRKALKLKFFFEKNSCTPPQGWRDYFLEFLRYLRHFSTNRSHLRTRPRYSWDKPVQKSSGQSLRFRTSYRINGRTDTLTDFSSVLTFWVHNKIFFIFISKF